MTVTIELPEDKAAGILAAAEARGQDLNTFAVALMVEAADEVQAALKEAIEDDKAGRLLTLEDASAQMEALLAESRNRRLAKAA